MPSPIVTCLLVAAVLLALAVPVAGAALAVVAGVIEFLIPAV